MFEAIKTIINSFGIIQPVNRKNNFLVIKFFFYAGANTNHGFVNTGSTKFLIINTNRKLVGLHHSASIINSIELAFYLQNHFSRLNEMLHIIMRMKTNQVR